MQYQSSLSRDQLVELAIHRYFANVDRKDMEAVLDCFHDEALFTTQTSFTTHAGKPALRRMYETFFATYRTIVHRDFTCTVDARNGRIAANFTAEITDQDGRLNVLHNTNFWRVRGDRFQEIYVYMSGANVLV